MDACSWCGAEVHEDAGLRAAEPAGEVRAAFCRLEHVVPWVLQGARWDDGELPGADGCEGLGRCAQCASALNGSTVLLVSHRGPHRIADAFCGTEHLLEWARAGGRYGVR